MNERELFTELELRHVKALEIALEYAKCLQRLGPDIDKYPVIWASRMLKFIEEGPSLDLDLDTGKAEEAS